MGSTQRVRYASVNGSWPEGELPIPTGQEAISAVKRLYRVAMGKPWKGKLKLTSGNRHTWPSGGVYYVNPNRQGWSFNGWKDIVHAVSHYCHRRLHPTRKPHDFRHELLEKELVRYVVSHGWLEGKLRREPAPKPDVRTVRAERVKARIEAWERKRRRAETALKKLKRTHRYYEQQQA